MYIEICQMLKNFKTCRLRRVVTHSTTMVADSINYQTLCVCSVSKSECILSSGVDGWMYTSHSNLDKYILTHYMHTLQNKQSFNVNNTTV